MGSVNETRKVSSPLHIECELSVANAQCNTVRVREYTVFNHSNSVCAYNPSIYTETIEVTAVCDDNGLTSRAAFCHLPSDGAAYLWSNHYFGNNCSESRLFEAEYVFAGCQGDQGTFVEVLQCGEQSTIARGEREGAVEPFGDSVFVAGFVLLLIAVVCIAAILVWYCAWFKRGFNSSTGSVNIDEM